VAIEMLADLGRDLSRAEHEVLQQLQTRKLVLTFLTGYLMRRKSLLSQEGRPLSALREWSSPSELYIKGLHVLGLKRRTRELTVNSWLADKTPANGKPSPASATSSAQASIATSRRRSAPTRPTPCSAATTSPTNATSAWH
jgi:hypothetical protein